MVEWGAKTIPEGGYYSVPERRHGNGVCVVGDAAGYVDVPSLKGIHYAMHSGILAARAIFSALKARDVSEAGLRSYTESVNASYIMKDLRRTRNVRLAFKKGFLRGAVRAGLMTLSAGAIPGGKITTSEDAEEERVLGGGGPGVRTRREAHVQQGGRGLQSREPDVRRRAQSFGGWRRREPRSGRAVHAHVSCRRLRARW